jgi:hypothetical protein
LRFHGFIFLTALRALQNQPENGQGHDNYGGNEDSVHSFSDSIAGNGTPTLAESKAEG